VAKPDASFTYRLPPGRSCVERRRREGRYLLRTNLTESDQAKLGALPERWRWKRLQELKGDLAIRPIFHQKRKTCRRHISGVSFLAYCLHVTLGNGYIRSRRTHATQCAGEVRRSADDRRTSATTAAVRSFSRGTTQPSPN